MQLSTSFNKGISEISASKKYAFLIVLLAWNEIKQRYKRSVIGPFWLTISMSVMIATIGFVFSQVFDSSLDEFIPYLAVGIILWTLISSTLEESCDIFVQSGRLIKQLNIPFFVYIAQVLLKSTLIFAHNIILIPVLFIIFSKEVNLAFFMLIPGFVVFIANLAWVAIVLSTICTRYRDLLQIVRNLIQVAFYVTPVIWMPSQIPERFNNILLQYNPGYHLLEIMRAPILGYYPSLLNWYVTIGAAILGWLIAFYIFGRYSKRIVFWI